MKRLFALLALASLPGCRPGPKQQLTVASAANLTEIFAQLGPRFERDTGIHLTFSFASTSQLTQQIENGAPFDVFTAADAQHVAELEQKGLLTAGSRAAYARGVLALWIPPSSKATIQRIQDLALPDIRVIAVAKPLLAPYGEATLQTLQKLGIWDQVKSKVVYAENISMAEQYGNSNNADAVFTAYSLVLHKPGKIIQVDESLHQPIEQELGIVARSQHQEAAKKFTAYLLTGAGKQILASCGYQPPAGP